MKKQVLIILIGNIRYDGRVQKIINSLIENNYLVELICTEMDKDDSVNNYNYIIHHINRKSGGGILLQLFRTIFFFSRCRKLIKRIKPSYIHCNDLCSTIYAFGFYNKCKVVFDSHELSLDLYKGLKRMLYIPIERYVVRKSYKIILPQIDRLNIFYFKYKKYIDKSKLYLIENFPVKQSEDVSIDFFSDHYDFMKSDGEFIISYTGVIQRERKLDVIIRSMRKINHSYLFIIGLGEPSYIQYLEELIISENLQSRVFIKNPVPNQYMLHIAASSDIGICLYGGANINSYFCASNKIYEYLNMGVKVITNNLGGTSRIIEHKKNGFLIDEISEEAIITAVRCLSNCFTEISTNYFWDSQENTLLNIYK